MSDSVNKPWQFCVTVTWHLARLYMTQSPFINTKKKLQKKSLFHLESTVMSQKVKDNFSLILGEERYLVVMMCSHCPTHQDWYKKLIQKCVELFRMQRDMHQHRFLLGSMLIYWYLCLSRSLCLYRCWAYKRTITMKHRLYFVKLIQQTGHVCGVSYQDIKLYIVRPGNGNQPVPKFISTKSSLTIGILLLQNGWTTYLPCRCL